MLPKHWQSRDVVAREDVDAPGKSGRKAPSVDWLRAWWGVASKEQANAASAEAWAQQELAKVEAAGWPLIPLRNGRLARPAKNPFVLVSFCAGFHS